MTALILDTDIGTDVDDALALAVILGSPEIDLIGVTTVYGDTLLRARLARRLARLARPEIDIPFIPGIQQTLSGREVWWPGHEGALFTDLNQEPVQDSLDAIDYLTTTVAARPHLVDILAIGPLTNIAHCLRRDASFARNVGRLFVMGGDFTRPDHRLIEHNFRCDAVAAHEVFASDLTVIVTGLDVTTQVRLADPEIAAIGSAGPLGRTLKAEIEQFWKFHGKAWNNPHDPVAALTLLQPDAFTSSSMRLSIVNEGSQEGLAVSAEDPMLSRTKVVTGINIETVTTGIISRIECAGLQSASPSQPG